ncbi:uncharacterized protein LOC115783595 isoform X2 [Archocentrus centrarchus]|uniref:uncharacterized protein LOC115783595 isoform X2 n=1 Tax=Archocentrus centrarchus TaxID=63155 RepID=UPI0011EA2C31|nr:uncharacterized protein LOC115783595 isoform X2 [Archocentrus centrarchus]
MKVHHTLICFFFLSLQDGNTDVNLEKNISYGVSGRNLTAVFPFAAGTWKMFCREKCEGENILINTTDDTHQRGRYSSGFKSEDGAPVLSVSITILILSDAGQYRCGVGGASSSYRQFEIIVAEALLDGNDDQRKKHFYKEAGSSLTVGCSFKDSGSRKSFCRGGCGGDEVLIQTQDEDAHTGRYRIGSRGSSGGGVILYVSITQLSSSDSGQYRCSLDQTSFRDFEITVTDDVSLYVGLTLAAAIILLSVALLIFCKKRSSKANDRPVETDYAAVSDANIVYEEIRDEDRQNGAPPVEITSLYALAKYTKTNEAETTDDYSVITAAPSEDKDDPNKLRNCELNGSKTEVGSPSSASSEPQMRPSSDPSPSGGNPLYSTLT